MPTSSSRDGSTRHTSSATSICPSTFPRVSGSCTCATRTTTRSTATRSSPAATRSTSASSTSAGSRPARPGIAAGAAARGSSSPSTRSGRRRPTAPGRSAPAEAGWVRGDLHCHTLYSDGDSWPSEMLLAAAEAGLEFLGVTDHNSVAHHAEYGAGGGMLPIVVPGVEVTTYHGHWNAWGTDRWYDFRDPTDAGVSSAMRDAVSEGAFISICHPKPF